ncbi:AraC family transcriptional regulator [Lichenibacterium minor]|uniref:AraC family transcriptional regulator n=1 Tax=Lichenibacterium minor TaxID=2316528 RepID=A0A4V1RUE5_9HYPH|nr:AraC family transcriptional regulator [Lichenibacterium minor]RYC30874.1 AraC family transcriptional regulator [Lichenibacterium minor]
MLIADTTFDAPVSARPDTRAMSKACGFIEAHLAEPVLVPEIARQAGVSERRLLSLFHASRGITPHAYLMERRVKRALALLQDTDTPISEIALRTGFADQSAMTRWIRRLHGTTPARFRKARMG